MEMNCWIGGILLGRRKKKKHTLLVASISEPLYLVSLTLGFCPANGYGISGVSWQSENWTHLSCRIKLSHFCSIGGYVIFRVAKGMEDETAPMIPVSSELKKMLDLRNRLDL